MKKYFIARSILVFLPALFFLSCLGTKSPEEMETMLVNNYDDFTNTARLFLNQEKIAGMTIAFGRKECAEINSWKQCGGKDSEWERWSVSVNDLEKLPSVNDVLNSENISQEKFEFFKSFLSSNRIRSIRKLPGGLIAIEDGSVGLRYNESPETYFNSEGFKTFKKIDRFWYVYEKGEAE